MAGAFGSLYEGFAQDTVDQGVVIGIESQNNPDIFAALDSQSYYKNNSNSATGKTFIADNPEITEEENETETHQKTSEIRSYVTMLHSAQHAVYIIESIARTHFLSNHKLSYDKALYLIYRVFRI